MYNPPDNNVFLSQFDEGILFILREERELIGLRWGEVADER